MPYEKQIFVNRIIDKDGNIIQAGTNLRAEHFNKMENAIALAIEGVEHMPINGGGEETYRILEESDIDSTLSVEGKVAEAKATGDRFATLTEDIAELGDGYIALTAPLANETGCDWNLNDVPYTSGAITPKLESNGVLRIDFAEDIRGIGLLLYVMTATSGKSQQYEVNELTITEASYTFEITDTCRVMIAAGAGMVHYFDRVQAGTSIYTLTTEANFCRLQNRIIGNQKIWCFGDSLTAGVITGTTTIEQSYPYWLGKFLSNDAAEIANFGVPGASAQDMLAAVQEKDFYNNCDIALLMIGTNGFLTGDKNDPTTSCGAYHAAIRHIIDASKGMTKIVLLNPPKSVREGVPTRWLDAMHYNIQQIAHEYGLDCIDLYKFLPFTPDDMAYYSEDKVHFTGKGYYYIAYIVYNYLVNHMTASQIGGSPTFDY